METASTEWTVGEIITYCNFICLLELFVGEHYGKFPPFSWVELMNMI